MALSEVTLMFLLEIGLNLRMRRRRRRAVIGDTDILTGIGMPLIQIVATLTYNDAEVGNIEETLREEIDGRCMGIK